MPKPRKRSAGRTPSPGRRRIAMALMLGAAAALALFFSLSCGGAKEEASPADGPRSGEPPTAPARTELNALSEHATA